MNAFAIVPVRAPVRCVAVAVVGPGGRMNGGPSRVNPSPPEARVLPAPPVVRPVVAGEVAPGPASVASDDWKLAGDAVPGVL